MSLRPRPLSGQAAGIPDVVRSAKHSDSVKRKLAQRLPSEEFRIRRHDPDLWLYRERTMGILRRYQRLSVEVGRLPSLLGREFFRTRVTSYHAGTFEDSVIFVHDVARGLEQLGGFEYKLIAKIALQDYTQHETARVLGCWRRTVGRRFPEALDRLTDIFLEAGLLIRLPDTDVARAENCQEGKVVELPASACVQRE
jgi:DNA-directed RNA polymerase specialized sigma24 family protein